jgi:hypothetical protein
VLGCACMHPSTYALDSIIVSCSQNSGIHLVAS